MSENLHDPLIPSSPLTPGEEKMIFGSSSASKIVIHYWSNYDSGEHKIHEMQVGHNSRILDIILESLEIFHIEHNNISDYCLRIANAKGKPKTSMPAFDVAQNVLETGSLKFALCVKNYETGEEFERVTSPVLPAVKPTVSQGSRPEVSLQQSENRRRKICCCFYSD